LWIAPFPWFGGKSRAADLVWERFGDVPNYVEPFAGIAGRAARASDAAARGNRQRRGLLPCELLAGAASRSRRGDVAHWADAPVNEADLARAASCGS
jgi:hypothetical protein